MVLPPNQQSSTVPPPSIKMVETSPSEIVLHRIEDHQLEQLTNISRPLTLAAAGAATGAFFSLLPSAVEAASKVGTLGFNGSAMVYCLLATISFILAVMFGASAFRGEIEAKKVVKAIRDREHRQI